MKNFKLIILMFVLSTILDGCKSVPMVMSSFAELKKDSVVEVPNLSKNEIYIKVNEWYVKTFNSAESVIEFQDKERGKIMGKYVFSFTKSRLTYYIKQVVSIDIKDEKIRIVIDSPAARSYDSLTNTDSGYSLSFGTQFFIDTINLEWDNLISSLSKHLNTKENEW